MLEVVRVFRVVRGSIRKRQRTGALQDASRDWHITGKRLRFGLSTLRSIATEDRRWPSTALLLTMSLRWWMTGLQRCQSYGLPKFNSRQFVKSVSIRVHPRLKF